MNNLSLGFQNIDCSRNYAYGRPSYSKECTELLKQLGVKSNDLVLDLACGTGKFTQVLATNGFNNIVAVEPSSEFRDMCESELGDIKMNENQSLNFKVLDGMSTSIPLPNSSVECCIVAHAFHWFSNLESIIEISRVLKPNGLLVILWIRPDPTQNSTDLLRDIVQLHKDSKYNGGSDGRKSPTALLIENWRDIFNQVKENQQYHHLINPNLIDHPTIHYTESTCGQRVIANSLSQSYMSLLSSEKKQIFINDLTNNLQNNSITSNNKQFNLVYKIDLYYTRKPNNK